MGKSLIITEKPSVAQEFARVFGVSGRQDGYIENNEYVISWCVGHLVEMVYPEVYDEKYKKWRLEDLPFLPTDYKYGVINNVKKQYDIVHGLLFREDIDRVYWAGDAGKEGQVIEENIRMYGGVREGMEELRVWIDSQTEEEIRRGVEQAKPMSAYENLGKSGIMRSIEDYAMGINFSRAMSVKYGNLLNDAAGTTSYTAIAVGRVMTCVLGMVVIREREIRNFVETPFFRVVGKFTDANLECEWKAVEDSKYFESPLLYKENGFRKIEDATNLMEQLTGKEAVITSLEKGTAKKRAPLLFNLAELQAECSKRFKISPDETLQVAQDLYEKKLTTYPRTDARVLSTGVSKEIYKNISRLKSYEPVTGFVEQIMKEGNYKNIAKTSYVDDSKVTDHYAIIPTGQLTELNSLNELQRKVFDMIVRRFLSIFYAPALYQTVKITVGVDGESLFASTKVLKEPGFLEIAGIPGKQNQENAESTETEDGEDSEKENAGLLQLAENLNKGDVIASNGFDIKEGKTSPPKRYTSGSMVLAMENAGQLIEDEELRAQIKGSGIGTSATRAEIIKKLVRIGYLNLNKKSQVLSPEKLGEMIFEVVNMTVPALLNPQMTASWEKGLDGITNGTVEFLSYREKLEEFIRKETNLMIGNNLTSQIANKIRPFTGKNARGIAAKKSLDIPCPMCGTGIIETTPFGYGCSNYKKEGDGCHFAIGTIAGRDLTEEEVTDLITYGETKALDGFLSKSKKKFKSVLVMSKDEEGKINITFDFSKVEPELIEGLQCPVCGGAIEKTPFGYSCVTHHKEPEKCYFSVGKIAGKAITVEDLTALLTTGRTEVLKGFVSKSKKRFSAALVLGTSEDGKKNISFDFSQNEPELVEGVQCPVCGGPIEITSYGYSCVTHHKEPEKCYFSVGDIAGKSISTADLTALLTTGRTEVLKGFISKSKKKFSAALVLETAEDGKKNITFDFSQNTPDIIEGVSCPMCGGNIEVKPFGYGCSNYDSANPDSCRFAIGKIAGKDLNPAQVKALLTDGRTPTIRGFVSKTKKKFDACIALATDENGVKSLKFDFDNVEAKKVKDVKCPLCGGDIVQTPFGFGCANYSKDNEESCRFSIGKIAGVKIKEAQVKELLLLKKTDEIKGFKSKSGTKFDAPLKLTEDGRVVFDFPEKPKPVDTTVKCPKCGELLKKSQWYYECDCGFKVSHTIAKVPLTEAIMKEVLETGKTNSKIAGFVSRAGNQFETCLKFEDDRIQFDFDNPGYTPQPSKMPQSEIDPNLPTMRKLAEESPVSVDETPTETLQTDHTPPVEDDMAAMMAMMEEEEAMEQQAGMNFLDEFRNEND